MVDYARGDLSRRFMKSFPSRESEMNHKKSEPRPKVFTYLLPGDWTVLAGRTDADNEMLSLNVAKPKDWWFHVRGVPGSHVLLRTEEDREPDRETLKHAATIAAYHSKARHGGKVTVAYTRACFVSKPRGAPLGTVTIKREKIIKVRPGIPPAATS